MSKHIIIIGGGLAGASAAYTLTNRGYKVTILESNDYLGGRIRSVTSNGTTFEMGAAFMKKNYVNVFECLDEINLKSKLYRPHASQAGIVRGGKARVATFTALAGKGLLSWPAKVEAVQLAANTIKNWSTLDVHDLWKAAKLDTHSVSDAFASKRQQEFLNYALQPALDGYLYWSPEHTSNAMLLMAIKAFLQGGTYRLQDGLQQIVSAIASGGTVLLKHTVQSVWQHEDKSYTLSILHDGGESTLTADGIVCATTANAVPRIFPQLTDAQRSFFGSIEYSSTAVMAQVYDNRYSKGDVGIAFPRVEGKQLSVASISPEPSQHNNSLSTLKVYASGAYGKDYITKTDGEIVRKLTAELSDVRGTFLTADALPLSTHVQRWPEALPFFDVGHFKRLDVFAGDEIESPTPGLVFAGDYLGGPFMEGAFTSGLQAAERLDVYFNTGLPKQ